nr:hypothetical protein [Tanacetum cinerariifolium]GEY62222.1 hypothetical protein [Tanacetum cinerariifolium]
LETVLVSNSWKGSPLQICADSRVFGCCFSVKIGVVFELFEWPFPLIKLSVPKKKDKKITSDVASDRELVYKRPYCEEFLKFCIEIFEVGIWSSAREQNMQWVLTNVVGELKSKILFTWDQNQCMDTGFKCSDKRDKPLFIKELRHVWDNKYSNLPWRDGEYSSSNTFSITASAKALLNHYIHIYLLVDSVYMRPNIGILPQNYDPKNKEDNFLGRDGELWVFLNGLAGATDVPTYVNDHRIGRFIKAKLYEGP